MMNGTVSNATDRLSDHRVVAGLGLFHRVPASELDVSLMMSSQVQSSGQPRICTIPSPGDESLASYMAIMSGR